MTRIWRRNLPAAMLKGGVRGCLKPCGRPPSNDRARRRREREAIGHRNDQPERGRLANLSRRWTGSWSMAMPPGWRRSCSAKPPDNRLVVLMPTWRAALASQGRSPALPVQVVFQQKDGHVRIADVAAPGRQIDPMADIVQCVSPGEGVLVRGGDPGSVYVEDHRFGHRRQYRTVRSAACEAPVWMAGPIGGSWPCASPVEVHVRRLV